MSAAVHNVPPPPVDTATIQATIDRARRTGTGRLELDDLAELEQLLRGHIALLLPEARQDADRLWRGSIEWYQRTARLDGIANQARQGLGSGRLSAHTQVTTLARDCQWLLEQHTARSSAASTP